MDEKRAAIFGLPATGHAVISRCFRICPARLSSIARSIVGDNPAAFNHGFLNDWKFKVSALENLTLAYSGMFYCLIVERTEIYHTHIATFLWVSIASYPATRISRFGYGRPNIVLYTNLHKESSLNSVYFRYTVYSSLSHDLSGGLLFLKRSRWWLRFMIRRFYGTMRNKSRRVPFTEGPWTHQSSHAWTERINFPIWRAPFLSYVPIFYGNGALIGTRSLKWLGRHMTVMYYQTCSRQEATRICFKRRRRKRRKLSTAAAMHCGVGTNSQGKALTSSVVVVTVGRGSRLPGMERYLKVGP